MNTAKLGILSPTSTCHTFDASADGYGRAEGAGALYVKRLSDAIRDGNPIRGVIRATAVNTYVVQRPDQFANMLLIFLCLGRNGKVEGMGITHPSAKGQERVVRMAYEKAALDPRFTAYAELHGTGTPVGDPIEVRAISRALNDTRSEEEPLLLGAVSTHAEPKYRSNLNEQVKPNIGHSEAASGIFAVMKAALMTEAALIPGVALLNRLNPESKGDRISSGVFANLHVG
jgi:acyl transferase domain-containing protein